MKIEVLLSRVQVPLDKVEQILPKESHLQKLAQMPPLKEDAIRRVINSCIEDNHIVGYKLDDWGDNNSYEGCKYVPIGRLKD